MNIVITGGSRGFGYAMTKKFLELGDSVVICSRSKERVNATIKELKDINPENNIFGMVCDVTNYDLVEKFGEFAVEKLSSVDLWINNAGTTTSGTKPFYELKPEKIEIVIQTNLLGSLYGCLVALKIMLKQGSGKIFNIEGLGSDNRVVPNQVAYIATKSAIPKITKALKLELKDKNVGVHSINPGMMVTDLVVENIKNEPMVLNIIAETPDKVANYLVPKMRKIKGKGKRLKFTKGWKIFLKFLTAWRCKDRFMDKDGNCLIDYK